MTAVSETTRPSLLLRAIFAVPVIGWIIRDVMTGDESNIYYAVGIFLTVWLIAVMMFGYPAIIIPALALVPIMFIILVLISRG